MKNLLAILFLKKIVFAFILFTPLFSSAAVYSPKMAQTVSTVIEQKAVSRGFAANDPIFGSTINTVAAVLTTAATGAAVATGMPVWVSIGIGAVAAGLISLAIDSAVSWINNSDGTVTVPLPDPLLGLPVDGDGLVFDKAGMPPDPYFGAGQIYNNNALYFVSKDPVAVAAAVFFYPYCGNWTGCPGFTFRPIKAPIRKYSQSGGLSNSVEVTWIQTAFNSSSYEMSSSISALREDSVEPMLSQPSTVLLPTYQPGPSEYIGTPENAVDSLPSEDRQKLANPSLIADIVNTAWEQAASQPDYEGLPYSYSDPVTVEDILNLKQQRPDIYPTVEDLVSTVLDPYFGTINFPVPYPDPFPDGGYNPNPNPNPGGVGDINVTVDLGVDPGIGAPMLEGTPTGSDVMAPLLALMPDLKNFQVPQHQAVCPTPTFDIAFFDKQVVMDAQCTLSESIRGEVYNGSLLMWIIVALFIVLSA